MRARTGLAQCLWTTGEREQAVDHFQDMLRLNPGDNQGLRYMLASWLLELGRDEQLGQLLKKYKDDGSAAWAYTEALLAFRREGDCRKSRKRLAEAIEVNPHVPPYLAGKKKLPRQPPDYMGFGDDSEAVSYAAEGMTAWKNTPGALDWLAAHAGGGA